MNVNKINIDLKNRSMGQYFAYDEYSYKAYKINRLLSTYEIVGAYKI